MYSLSDIAYFESKKTSLHLRLVDFYSPLRSVFPNWLCHCLVGSSLFVCACVLSCSVLFHSFIDTSQVYCQCLYFRNTRRIVNTLNFIFLCYFVYSCLRSHLLYPSECHRLCFRSCNFKIIFFYYFIEKVFF